MSECQTAWIWVLLGVSSRSKLFAYGTIVVSSGLRAKGYIVIVLWKKHKNWNRKSQNKIRRKSRTKMICCFWRQKNYPLHIQDLLTWWTYTFSAQLHQSFRSYEHFTYFLYFAVGICHLWYNNSGSWIVQWFLCSNFLSNSNVITFNKDLLAGPSLTVSVLSLFGKLILMQTGWILASRWVTRRLPWDPTCLPLSLPFHIKSKQNVKLFNSRQHLKLFFRILPSIKVSSFVKELQGPIV